MNANTEKTRMFRFDHYYQDKWISPAYIEVSAEGHRLSVSTKEPKNVTIERVAGIALPGFVNAHSHAFQYAMVGLAEHLGRSNTDDFWSWREKMYAVAAKVNPDQMEAIATQLYAEMLRAGYTSVTEFHYLHHQKNGKSYDNIGEMSDRLIAAAARVGIDITLVPIFYQRGGFQLPALAQQQRFTCSTVEDYLTLVAAVKQSCNAYRYANWGIGVHSLRAASASSIKQVFGSMSGPYSKHLHIAEQLKEVDECQSVLGMRPVEWLIENIALDETYNLIHATHINEREIDAMVKQKVNVVLCPSTEANLGDGVFPLARYMKKGGTWAIGTDSHVGLDPWEELRLLDYGQRLQMGKRNVVCLAPETCSAQTMLDQVLTSRYKVTGVTPPFFDAVVFDSNFPLLQVTSPQYLLPTLLYCCDATARMGTLSKGKWVVKDGIHLEGSKIIDAYQRAMKQINLR